MVSAFHNHSAQNEPIYGIAEAARYIPGLVTETLRSWVRGRKYPLSGGATGEFKPLIEPPDPEDGRMSFTNLVEAHVLYALRSYHLLTIKSIREALDYAECEFQISHLLAHTDLRAGAGDLFMERYGQLVNLSQSGQLGMRRVLADCLQRLVHDDTGLPVRFYPLMPNNAGQQDVMIDPTVAFGKPVWSRVGVRVVTLADRIDAGETVGTVASDYGLQEEEVEKAVAYAQVA